MFFLLIWERETSTQKENINRLPPACIPTGDWTHNLCMCPDWEWNPLPFGVWDSALTYWATQSGLPSVFLLVQSFPPNHTPSGKGKFPSWTPTELFISLIGPLWIIITVHICIAHSIIMSTSWAQGLGIIHLYTHQYSLHRALGTSCIELKIALKCPKKYYWIMWF